MKCLGRHRAEVTNDVIKLLERAADDNGYVACLTYEGFKTLQGYNLTLEEKAALLSGDIRRVEAHIGKLGAVGCGAGSNKKFGRAPDG